MNYAEHMTWGVLLLIYSILKIFGTPSEIEQYKEIAKMKLDELNRMNPELQESKTQHRWNVEAAKREVQTGATSFHWFCSVVTSAPLLGLAVRLIMTAA